MSKTNKKIKNHGREEIIKSIKRDCLDLKKHNNLTEYGKGQLDLIKIIQMK